MMQPLITTACAALQIRSSLPATESRVKLILDQAFPEIEPQEVITVVSPEHFENAIELAHSFLAKYRQTPHVLFLLIDLVLLDADVTAVAEGPRNPRKSLAWRPSRDTFQDLFSYYGEALKSGSYRLHFGDKCLYSIRLLLQLWNILDGNVIVVFNAGRIRMSTVDLAELSARLGREGVSWLYTEEDEREGGQSFLNSLRISYNRAAGAFPESETRRSDRVSSRRISPSAVKRPGAD